MLTICKKGNINLRDYITQQVQKNNASLKDYTSQVLQSILHVNIISIFLGTGVYPPCMHKGWHVVRALASKVEVSELQLHNLLHQRY